MYRGLRDRLCSRIEPQLARAFSQSDELALDLSRRSREIKRERGRDRERVGGREGER